METLKYLLITLLCAGVLGTVFGLLIGKYLVNKAKHGGKPLLQKKERYIYMGSVALGMICICFGLYFQLPGAQTPAINDETVMAGESTQSGGMIRRGNRGGGGGVAYAVRVG